MKQYLATIIAAYIFVLTVIPCTHKVDCLNHHLVQTETLSKSLVSDTDHCSPFCTCNCCSTPVIYHFAVLHFEYFFSLNKPFYPLQEGKTINSDTSFWQPPKIG
jgi:hypothetical protein